MAKVNVLIFPVGDVNSVELHNALSTCVNIEVFGATSIDRHGEYIYKNYISGLPLITEENFIEEFNRVLVDNQIDFIFPVHDTVVTFLADNRDKIKAKIMCAETKTSQICRDKKLIYEIFSDCSFNPIVYKDFSELPVFAKPRKGQGGVGAFCVQNETDIPNIDISDYVICEYLPGIEYSVDCITDNDGVLRFISPRSRKRTMAGISVAGQNEKLTQEIEHIAKTINERLKFNGLWFFQIKQDKNKKWKLLEIATRHATSMSFTRAIGVNLPLLSIYLAMGKPININPNKYNVKMDSTLIRRYKIDYDYETVYFDFDDTLIIKEQVYLPAISFLFQCKNKGIKVILLTKHEKEIYQTMKKYHIDSSIFNEIIHIEMNDKKSKYINPNKAIFIDNSFQERQDVSINCNIPVFDVDGIDVLIDWRK